MVIPGNGISGVNSAAAATSSAGGSGPRWYEQAGSGFRICYTEEYNGGRDVVGQITRGAQVSESRSRLGNGNFSSTSGGITLEGRGKQLYVNGQRVDLSLGRELSPEEAPATSRSTTSGMAPMQPMAPMRPMQPMAPMRPMQPMAPMQPMRRL